MKFCGACGAQLQPDSPFCWRCGWTLPAAVVSTVAPAAATVPVPVLPREQAAPTGRRRPGPLVHWLVTALLALAGAGIALAVTDAVATDATHVTGSSG